MDIEYVKIYFDFFDVFTVSLNTFRVLLTLDY